MSHNLEGTEAKQKHKFQSVLGWIFEGFAYLWSNFVVSIGGETEIPIMEQKLNVNFNSACFLPENLEYFNLKIEGHTIFYSLNLRNVIWISDIWANLLRC